MPASQLPHRILLLDPAPQVLGWLVVALQRSGHATEAIRGLEELADHLALPATLVIARVAPGQGPSPALLRRIRQLTTLPCLLVPPASEGVAERVAAFALGAEDCLHAAMSRAEMLARVLAALRRAGRVAPPRAEPPRPAPAALAAAPIAAPILLAGGWHLAPGRMSVLHVRDGRTVRLTSAEFALLRLLAASPGEPVDRDTISRSVFRRPWRVEDRAVDGLVKRLRRKLDEDAIATIRGIGYGLLPAGPALPAAAQAAQEAPSL